ncbi:ATP-binding protein [Desulfocurvus vexinensis]|uniref:ATP-binding protein n=1 Tax=Desulfocurvus vexinensis TaxID=399548 RepID=UPI00048DC11C|nr:ATP-binding protein [Desulfocurvus vexinensis]
MATLRLPAALDRLDQYREFVLGCAREAALPADREGKLELILEELLVNVARYAYPDGQGEVELCCGADPGRFVLVIRDWGPPFDPLAACTPDLDAGVDERPIGGLGIFFVRQMADGLAYRREDGANELTIHFDLPR